MEGTFGVQDLLRDLPQAGRAWLEEWAKPSAIQPSFLELCVTIQIQESRLMPQWLNETSVDRRNAIWYPMHLEKTACSGRVHNGMYYLAKGLKAAGIEAESFVEERFCFTATAAGTVVLAESALLDDDSMIFSRLEMPADKSLEGCHRVVRVSASDTGRVLESGCMDAFPSCSFCSTRREICMCRLERGCPFPTLENGAAETAAGTAAETATDTTALDFWEGMKSAILSNFVFAHPRISETLRGPTPSPDGDRGAPRLLQFTLIDPSESLPALLKDHFASMARKRQLGTVLRLEWKLATCVTPASLTSKSRRAASCHQEVSPMLSAAAPREGAGRLEPLRWGHSKGCRLEFAGVSPSLGTDFRQRRHPQVDVDHVRATCTLCGKRFARKADLEPHLLSAHKSVKAFQCSVCEKRFSASRYLATHVTNVHERRRSAACPLCNDLFSTSHKMQLHVRRVHLNERPYSCEHCDHVCFQRSDLKRHVKRTHGDPSERLDGWGEWQGAGWVHQRADWSNDCLEDPEVGTSDPK